MKINVLNGKMSISEHFSFIQSLEASVYSNVTHTFHYIRIFLTWLWCTFWMDGGIEFNTGEIFVYKWSM